MAGFVKLVVKTIQTDYNNKKEAQKSMEALLNEADEMALELTGERIVKRGSDTVLEHLTKRNPLNKI